MTDCRGQSGDAELSMTVSANHSLAALV